MMHGLQCNGSYYRPGEKTQGIAMNRGWLSMKTVLEKKGKTSTRETGNIHFSYSRQEQNCVDFIKKQQAQ